VDGVVRGARHSIADPSPERLRPEAAMHKPLLKPDSLEGTRSQLADQRRQMRRAKCAKPHLGPRSVIGVARVQWRVHAKQNQQRVEVGLKEYIHTDICREVPTVADEARYGVDHLWVEWILCQLGKEPILDGRPVGVLGHVVNTRPKRAYLLCENLGAE
jgi:hypothetical protein